MFFPVGKERGKRSLQVPRLFIKRNALRLCSQLHGLADIIGQINCDHHLTTIES
jgi:hypothetical protein